MRTPKPISFALILSVCLVVSLSVSACAALGPANGASSGGQTGREAQLQQIAADFARDANLDKAQAALGRFQLANPGQLLVSMAEDGLVSGKPREEIAELSILARALGAHSARVLAYLTPASIAGVASAISQPPVAMASALPATSPTAASQSSGVVSSTSAPTATTPATVRPATASAPASAEASSAPATAAGPSATPTSAQPQVIGKGVANLRSGPGTGYPVVGQLQSGQRVVIIGRSAAADWWQLSWEGSSQAWVLASLVDAAGATSTVALAKNIPTPPPSPTPAPTAVPTKPAPTQTPKPSGGYVVKSLRLRPIGTDAQSCGGGDHNIWVFVVDAAGNRLDGVRVREIFTGMINVTGAQGKGQGTALWDIYAGGGGQIEIIDGGNNRISEQSRGMSADWPDFDLMKAAGYCSCKPHPDDASCQADIQNHTYLFAKSHYVFELTFQRTN